MNVVVLKRLKGLMLKETFQIFRDPSSLMIAFLLPTMLLFLYGFGLSLDIQKLKIGIVMEDTGVEVQSLVKSYTNSKYFDVKTSTDRHVFKKQLTSGEINGIIVIPQDFSKSLKKENDTPKIQIITDGSDPNTANFVQNYAIGAWSNWQSQKAVNEERQAKQLISSSPRFWFNPELESKRFLVPGSLGIILSISGTLLTSLVLAREWERGTMEALMSTPVSIFEILTGKLVPYFILGMISAYVLVFVSILLFDLPFKASFLMLSLTCGVFLFSALGLGLFISSIAKNQFVAAQISLFVGLLPAFLLSGFLFEIASMPKPMQIITMLIPARHFVSNMQTLFLTGDVLALLIPNIIKMFLIGLFLFVLTAKKTVKRLD